MEKILLVIDNLGSGGAQRQLAAVACGLKSRGYSVNIFIYHDSFHFREETEKKNIPVFLHKKTSRFSLSPVFNIRKIITELDIDVVISFLDTPNMYSEIACIGRDVLLIVSERSSYVRKSVSLSRKLMSHMHRLADVVVANSHTHALWLRENFKFLSSRVVAVINGVDTEVFDFDEEALRNRLCMENGSGKKQLNMIGVGRISSEKNILPVISALSRVRDQGLDVTVNWVGRVGDEKYHQECDNLIQESGLSEYWRWLGERKDVSDLLPKYDALIISSTREGFPNVVCEALACGLPVLGSRISDIPYLLGENERGILFNQNDVEDIARAVLEFSGLDTGKRIKISTNARSFAENMLSLDNLIDNYEKLLVNTD